MAEDMEDGLDQARHALETGGAREKLEQLVVLTGSFQDA
jgi:anthranilate phosphoribosyltransferase